MLPKRAILAIILIYYTAAIIATDERCDLLFDDSGDYETDADNIIEDLTYKYALIWARGAYHYLDGQCFFLPPPPKDPKKPTVELPNHFTIHGLWPLRQLPGKFQKFDHTKFDTDFKKKLYTDWPSVKYMTEQKAHGFWRHEWHGHGRKDPIFQSRPFQEYFQHIHDLYVTVVFDLSERVTVSRPNTLETLKQLYSEDETPYVRCVENGTGSIFVSELIFCMDSTATGFIRCEDEDDGICADAIELLYE